MRDVDGVGHGEALATVDLAGACRDLALVLALLPQRCVLLLFS